ncbi:DDE-type integrase/transposase/recombinase [Streptomyces sp. PA03-5A]|nr:DDE-type integrase/transposase/recombinase [Streptomyces sp. PA03-5A]
MVERVCSGRRCACGRRNGHLPRHGLNRLAHLDRPIGQVIRRYERDRPGKLIHIDVKKLGRIPDSGGHKVLGRQAGRARRSNMGFDYVHSAVDDHSRLAYREIHTDEKADTCAGFLRQATAFFAASGIGDVERVLTNNDWPYRKSFAWQQALADLGAAGKVERFHRTLLEEWARTAERRLGLVAGPRSRCQCFVCSVQPAWCCLSCRGGVAPRDGSITGHVAP